MKASQEWKHANNISLSTAWGAAMLLRNLREIISAGQWMPTQYLESQAEV